MLASPLLPSCLPLPLPARFRPCLPLRGSIPFRGKQVNGEIISNDQGSIMFAFFRVAFFFLVEEPCLLLPPPRSLQYVFVDVYLSVGKITQKILNRFG